MKLSDAGAAFIAAHEGFVPRWYLCPARVGTIGHGLTWRSAAFRDWWRANRPGEKFGPGATITREQSIAAKRVVADREYGKAVNDALKGRIIPQHAFDAATSAVFNLGPASITWRWGRALAKGDIETAARLLRQTGTTATIGGTRRVLPGLVRRRAEEAALMLHGDYAGVKAAPPKAAPADLSRGSRGGKVLALQHRLKTLGHYDGALDGVFGVGTEAALMAFQRARGLPADGVSGPVTLAALDEPEPKKAPEVPKPAPQGAPLPPAGGSDGDAPSGALAALLAMIAGLGGAVMLTLGCALPQALIDWLGIAGRCN